MYIFARHILVSERLCPGTLVECRTGDKATTGGETSILSAEYQSVAFSDHLAFIVKINIPGLDKLVAPRCRPLFKTSPEVTMDHVLKLRLKKEIKGWQHVKDRGLPILPWWEIIVKPGIRKLALNRKKELIELSAVKAVLSNHALQSGATYRIS